MSLRETLSNYWYAFQQELFPRLETDLGCLSERYEFFVTVVEFVRLEVLLPSISGLPGRPPEDRAALARAFIAKAVFDIPTTRALIERLQVDRTLYRLCGWSGVCRLPSEATFSRGFAEFADSALASRLHEALIARTLKDHLVGQSRACDGGHGPREAGAEGAQSGPPQAPAGAATQGRGTAQGTDPPGEATDDDAAGDVGRVAEGVRRWGVERQGRAGEVGRLQAAYRRGRWRESGELYLDLGVDA